MMIIIIWYLCFRANGVYNSYRHYPLNRLLWQYTKAVCYGMLILGGGTTAKEIIEAVRAEAWSGFRVIGCLGRYKRHVGKKVDGEVSVIGTYDDVAQMLNDQVVDELVLADDLNEIARVQDIVEMADEMGIHVHILPQWKIRELGINPKVGLGQNGCKFDLYKFRTMVPDAEARLAALQHANECDGPAFKIKNDPRIIPYIGTFLRKTGLDELPQFINVLKGELSVVGPRPPLPSEVKCYE